MDDFNSETDSDYTSYWRDWFISSRGNEYFCEIDEDYLTDRFNLTGLNTEVQYYQYALDLVTDVFDLDCDDEMRETIEKSARHLYGLVHARYIGAGEDAIDGAYFGTSFHNIIFQVYPALIPPKSADRYIPRIYGFRVHAPATLIRWQGGQKDDMRKRLRKLEIESGFKDDEAGVDAEESDDDEEDEEVDMDALENAELEGEGLQTNQI
ncbi:casein kinase II subunit beta-2 [Diplocarpon rosae]|nr:casein kinase II subunit beta-2 [Diplocarpon rosae]